MQVRPEVWCRRFLLALGFAAVVVLPASSEGALNGIVWFNGWTGWELVLRDNRFNLTDHSVQATFRGTFELTGENLKTVIDPRSTTFLEGPTRDQDKLSHIQRLVAEKRLPIFYADSPCSQHEEQEGAAPYVLKVTVSETSIVLSSFCGERQINQYQFMRVLPKD